MHDNESTTPRDRIAERLEHPRPTGQIVAEIHARWDEIVTRARTHPANLPARPRILGSSTKVSKGKKRGVLTAVVYLAPASESGRNLCPSSSPECRDACLGRESGKMVFAASKNSRLWKTALFLGDRLLFAELLGREITLHQARADHLGFTPAVRIDGASDTGFGEKVAPDFPAVTFYDYTKSVRRGLAHAAGQSPPNYHLTFSRSGRNDHAVEQVLQADGNVAIAFDARRDEPLPALHAGTPVVDGDETDARFLDPRGVVVGLRLKYRGSRERAIERAGRFVVRGSDIEPTAGAAR